MKLEKLTSLIVIAVFVALNIPLLAAQEQQQQQAVKLPHYTITDLGTLDGGSFSAASGVNNAGAVAGASILANRVAHVYLWRKGVMTDLGTLGGANSIDLGQTPINNSDAVVGSAETATLDPNTESFCSTANLICPPFVWQKDVMYPLPTLGGYNGAAFQINNRGQIVGSVENSTPDPTCPPPQILQLRAVVWEKGRPRELPPFPGDPDAVAEAINDKGQAVGGSGPCSIIVGNFSHALLWENGRPIDLGNLGGASGHAANQINNRGQIVGQSGTPDGFVHAFLWENEVINDLGTLPGLPISQALGINEKGEIVGFAQDANGDESSSVALLWQNGKLIDLNTRIAADSPWFLQEAFSINDRGQIAGHMFNRETNEIHAFLATPIEGEESSVPAVRENYETQNVIPEDVLQLLEQRGRFGRFIRFSRTSLAATIATSAPIVTLSPTSLTFATQAISTISRAKNVTLKNTGTGSLTITSIGIVGTNAADFAQTPACGGSLAVGASCSISVTFKPTASGIRTAALSIRDNAAASPQKVSVSGVGTAARLYPTSINFGTIVIGNPTRRKVTLTNVGTTTLTISGVTIIGADVGDFIKANYCSSSLVAGANCIIDVTFKPTTSGTRTAALNVKDSAAGSPQSVSLTGTGEVCNIQGAECTPHSPPCCPGLACRPAFTRAFCEPATSQIGDRTPTLRDRLPDE